MKKISFIFMLFWAAGGILAGCDNTLDGSGTYEPLYLEVAVSDSLGNTYTGDSIVIPTDKNKIILIFLLIAGGEQAVKTRWDLMDGYLFRQKQPEEEMRSLHLP